MHEKVGMRFWIRKFARSCGKHVMVDLLFFSVLSLSSLFFTVARLMILTNMEVFLLWHAYGQLHEQINMEVLVSFLVFSVVVCTWSTT